MGSGSLAPRLELFNNAFRRARHDSARILAPARAVPDPPTVGGKAVANLSPEHGDEKSSVRGLVKPLHLVWCALDHEVKRRECHSCRRNTCGGMVSHRFFTLDVAGFRWHRMTGRLRLLTGTELAPQIRFQIPRENDPAATLLERPQLATGDRFHNFSQG
jgi:hypothetical protein